MTTIETPPNATRSADAPISTSLDTPPLGWTRSHNPALPSAASSQVALRRPQDAVRHEPAPEPGEWVLLSYRIPRKLGTPRVTIWRKMKRLGVAQLGDGLVALPATAHTREDLDCIAEEILQVGRTAAVWLAKSASDRQERELCASMAAARSQEYRTVIAHAAAAASAPAAERTRTIRRLRDELLRIQSRDYFPPAERDIARRAVETLAGPRLCVAVDCPRSI
jgi:uncharacterized protein YdbL (DUF1318 family)